MRGTKKVRHGRLRPLSPSFLSSALTHSLSSFHACPALRKNKRIMGGAEEKGAPSLSLRSFAYISSVSPFPTSHIFISLSSSSAGLESLSRSLSISLLSVISHSCPFPSPLPSWFPAFRQTRKSKKGGRTSGGRGRAQGERRGEHFFFVFLHKLFLVYHQWDSEIG